jgi:hypothetical protein
MGATPATLAIRVGNMMSSQRKRVRRNAEGGSVILVGGRMADHCGNRIRQNPSVIPCCELQES